MREPIVEVHHGDQNGCIYFNNMQHAVNLDTQEIKLVIRFDLSVDRMIDVKVRENKKENKEIIEQHLKDAVNGWFTNEGIIPTIDKIDMINGLIYVTISAEQLYLQTQKKFFLTNFLK